MLSLAYKMVVLGNRKMEDVALISRLQNNLDNQEAQMHFYEKNSLAIS